MTTAGSYGQVGTRANGEPMHRVEARREQHKPKPGHTNRSYRTQPHAAGRIPISRDPRARRLRLRHVDSGVGSLPVPEDRAEQ